MNETMSTKELRIQIDKAIKDLIPLFKVTDEELKRFKKPEIRRILKPSEYPEHNRGTPAHSSLDNFIYFPLINHLSCNIFCQATIHHEVGHYVHYAVNPSFIEGIYTFLRTGKNPPGHRVFGELVAEYANFILNLRDYDHDISCEACFGKSKKIYDKQGPEFLPKLARMTLEEVIKEGIIKV